MAGGAQYHKRPANGLAQQGTTANPGLPPALPDREQQIAQCLELLGRLYTLPRNTTLIESALRDLWQAFGGFSGVTGARILDIGCGSEGCFENRYLRNTADAALYSPWLCRLCHELGAEAVGVDCGRSRPERFRFHQADLFEPDALAFLPSQSFDAVNMRLLISSPELVLRRKLSREQRVELGQALAGEARRLLQPDGRIIRLDLDVDNW